MARGQNRSSTSQQEIDATMALRHTRCRRLGGLEQGALLIVVALVAGVRAASASSTTASTLRKPGVSLGWGDNGAVLDNVDGICSCDTNSSTTNETNDETANKIYIGGIIDAEIFDWAPEIFNLTIALLNNRSDGFHDDIFNDTVNLSIENVLLNDACDERQTVESFWNVRIAPDDQKVHGIIGTRCSGNSITLARLSGLQQIPQVAPLSATSKLSDKVEFPFFNRLIAPNDARGAVGATVAMLRTFGWTRVTILDSDTQFARDTSNSLRQLWSGEHKSSSSSGGSSGSGSTRRRTSQIDGRQPTQQDDEEIDWTGQVAYSNTILLTDEGDIDVDSVQQVLNSIPVHDPTVHSRIVVLVAQEEHGLAVIKTAHDHGFPDDTIWVGLSWVARQSHIGTEWLQDVPYPGYIGVAPFRNHDNVAVDFLNRIRQHQNQMASNGPDATVWNEIEQHYSIDYVVDSIVALVLALSQTEPSQRRNGTAVVQTLRRLTFDGVSGPVSFTELGDRANPQYSIYNFQRLPVLDSDGTTGDGGSSSKIFDWVEVGTVGTQVGTAVLTNGLRDLCWARVGCNLTTVPSDINDIPKQKAPRWVVIVVPIIATLLLCLAVTYWRKSVVHCATVRHMTELQRQMEELQRINDKLADLDHTVQDVARRKDELILQRGTLIEKPATWSGIGTGGDDENDNDGDSAATTEKGVLVEVLPHQDEYWAVSDRLQQTLKTASIAKLWRIQNHALWSYYSFHKHRLERHKIDIHECAAWHGTSALDPSVVYNDRQDGFMMQYSERGFWGRGIYFAETSKYAHEYAHKASDQFPVTSTSTSARKEANGASTAATATAASAATDCIRPVGLDDERELFLVKLLVGESVTMDRDANAALKMQCSQLTVPPMNPRTNMRYNTVTGSTGDSKVWVVYENGRAYPDYLVRYYVGKRDEKRTPFRSRQHAASVTSSTSTSSTKRLSLSDSWATLTKPLRRSMGASSVKLQDGISESLNDPTCAVSPKRTSTNHSSPTDFSEATDMTSPIKETPSPSRSMRISLPDDIVPAPFLPHVPLRLASATTKAAAAAAPPPQHEAMIWVYRDNTNGNDNGNANDTNDVWHEYNPFHQTTIEVAYQEYLLHPNNERYRTVEIHDRNEKCLVIDFDAMVQVARARTVPQQPHEPANDDGDADGIDAAAAAAPIPIPIQRRPEHLRYR